MAKSSRPVNTQMPKTKISGMTSDPGLYDRNKPPFDKRHDTGRGGIPVKMFEDLGEAKFKKSTKTPTQVSPAGYSKK